MSELRSLLATGVALAVIIVVAAMLPWGNAAPSALTAGVATTSLSASIAATHVPSSTPVAASTSPAKKSVPAAGNAPTHTSTSTLAIRTVDPYPFSPIPTEQLNLDTRAALVNIFCTPRGGSLSPISGSGVIVDPRGVVLTNAHVAQYVLLSESERVNLVCMIRMGSPATPQYTPVVLAMPPAWVEAHAKNILTARPQGTGEHDWALLLMTHLETSQAAFPSAFPYLLADTRAAIGFVGDSVLAAGYPAEFVGGTTAQTGLYPVSSVSSIQQLLTLSTSSVDLVSIGSVIEAQGGSSGGPVVNQWDRLIGIITTTSEGTTTAQRDLRALTTDYINRDMREELGYTLAGLADTDVASMRRDFLANHIEDFTSLFIERLAH